MVRLKHRHLPVPVSVFARRHLEPTIFERPSRAPAMPWWLHLSLAVTLLVGSAVLALPESHAAAASDTWTVELLPTPSRSGYSSLLGISCPQVFQCVAVGAIIDSKPGALVETLTGTTWKATLAITRGLGTSVLQAVWCTGVSSCVAVGYYGPDNAELPLIETLSNGIWTYTKPPLPRRAVGATLSAINCLSTSKCVATGSYDDSAGKGHALFETLSHGHWNAQTGNGIAGSETFDVESVQCFSKTSCYGIGYWGTSGTSSNGLLETLSRTWTASTLESGVLLRSLWCSSSSSCIAVGYPAHGRGVTETLSGTTWKSGSLPGVGDGGRGSGIVGASCSHSDSSCVAIGSWRPPPPNSSVPLLLIEKLSDGFWTPTEVGAPSGYMLPEGVACPTIKTCVGIGTSESPDGGAEAVIERPTSGQS
jgi:hypothetical protein